MGTRTTFFFGAGASAALTVPPVVSSNLLALALRYPPHACPGEDLVRLQGLVTFLSGGGATRNVPTTDEILSLIDACINHDLALSAEWDIPNLLLARSSMVTVIYHFVEEVMHGSGGVADRAAAAPDRNPFLTMMRTWRGNSMLSVVSLNWDCLLENSYAKIAARNGAIDYGIALKGHDGDAYVPNSDALLVLKPHGSLSWGGCTLCGVLLLETAPYRAVAGLPCVCCGVGRIRTVLVPPALSHGKRPWYLDAIWALVEERIRESDRLVFVGYSLPPQDLDTRMHVLRALRQRRPQSDLSIEVVFLEEREGAGVERARYSSIFGGLPNTTLSLSGKGMHAWLESNV